MHKSNNSAVKVSAHSKTFVTLEMLYVFFYGQKYLYIKHPYNNPTMSYMTVSSLKLVLFSHDSHNDSQIRANSEVSWIHIT